MTRVEAVAQAYGLTPLEVATWSGRTVEIFHRVAVTRGWLTPPLNP
jgi:hypothetical protein